MVRGPDHVPAVSPVHTSLSPLPSPAVGMTEQPASAFMMTELTCRSVQLRAGKELQPPALCCGV